MLILFVSDNDLRSLLAEAIAKKLSRLALINADVLSCTLEGVGEIPETFYQALSEKGYTVEGLTPRTIEEVPYEKVDILITLSPMARDSCPYIQTHKRREHWNIEDVNPTDLPSLKQTIGQIEEKIKTLFKLTQT